MSEQQINDGGPAFPTLDNTEHWRHLGLSLRDYFAAAALQGLMAQVKPEDHWAEYRAKWSYEVADAMLKAREVKP
jgi:hypothetical protein